MLSPKRTRLVRHWDTIGDDQLLETQLTTDDPASLDGLVYELPQREGEPYVELAYDLRGSEREKLRCVQCGQPHLAGFVMRQEEDRFFIGHICGAKVYGESFTGYTADFDAAVDRRSVLQKVRSLRDATQAFMVWFASVGSLDTFRLFAKLRGQFREHMPWIYENVHRISAIAERELKVPVPKTLFLEDTDPRATFNRIAAELNSVANIITGDLERAAKSLVSIRTRLDAVLRQLDRMFAELEQPIQLFQPVVATYVTKVATESDNSNKRVYQAGLMSITCKGKDKHTVSMPIGYTIPDRRPMENLRVAIRAA